MTEPSASHVLAVQRAFAQHRRLFEAVEVALVAFDTRPDAERLLNELRSGETPFPAEIPATPRVLPTPPEVGYLGLVTRADLPAELAEPLFADDAPELIGPVRYAGRHYVCRRLLGKQPLLNDGVVAYCEGLLARASGAGSDG